MAFDSGLSAIAYRLASLLLHYEGDRGCFPSQARLSKDLGMSEDSVSRYLRELELYGFLAREKHNGFHNKYNLAPLYEPPIGHGSIEETGQLEIENAPKRRPPASGSLRVPRPDPELPFRALAPVKPIGAARSRRRKAESTPAIDVHDVPQEPPAPMRVVTSNVSLSTDDEPPATVRVVTSNVSLSTDGEPPAPVRVDHPHGCGSNKNNEEKNHQHQELGRLERSGGEEEKTTGLGSLQRANVNVARRDLGIHEGRRRALNDKELSDWAVWVTSKPASGIANKPAFCAAKIRMGCTVEDVFPVVAPDHLRDTEAASVAVAAAERDTLEQQRIDRADSLIAEMCKADRQQLRDRALRDSSVWIARNASGSLFAVMLAAAERRLVLGETEPCSIDRDLSAYREIPPL